MSEPDHLAIAVEALEHIAAGRPAGSHASTLAKDGTWREYVRDLQRVAAGTGRS